MELYLLPSILAPDTQANVIPNEVREAIKNTQFFLVEEIRTARRFISSLRLGITIEDLHFEICDKKTNIATVKAQLQKFQESGAKQVGVLSEAGCPGVADPGAIAVQAAYALGYNVKPLVGPSSILLTLMGSGFSGQNFAFNGYLPIDKASAGKEILRLNNLAQKGQTQLFMETPFRNDGMLSLLSQTLPSNTPLCIGADLTGANQLLATKTIADWLKQKPSLHKRPCMFALGTLS
jgi:16S rRNA (cytidine1402-2'-O)-methyltransferase